MSNAIPVYNKISQTINIKIAPFDPAKRVTRPHRHNKYLEIVFFSLAKGIHVMDDVAHLVDKPVAFIITNDTVHHWDLQEDPQGYVMIIKADFLEQTLDKEINTLLVELTQYPCIPLKPCEQLSKLFEVAHKELTSKEGSNPIFVEGVIKALLAKIMENAHQIDAPSTDDMLVAFQRLLDTNLVNDVSFYASQLNTTPQNLNTRCKKAFAKTTTQVIAQNIIKEAKRLLIYTDLSVTEIADTVDFKDVSHFVKYFKKHTGITPLDFKRKNYA